MVHSNDNVIKNNDVSGNRLGIYISYFSNFNKVEKNIATNTQFGITLLDSSNDNLVCNNILTQNGYGISVQYESCFNVISKNSISGSTGYGIELETNSRYNVMVDNIITKNWIGIYIGSGLDYPKQYYGSASDNVIINNDVIDNIIYGIVICSHNNMIAGNIVTKNDVGILFNTEAAYDNKFYHNNFICNTVQVAIGVVASLSNIWDNGYPSGGNYWSDYTGVDKYRGPYQNVLGSDDIGDTPYIVYESNFDRYPLMEPWDN